MAVREDYVQVALDSYQGLSSVVMDLTEEELHAALDTESQGQRRPALLERMIRRLVRLTEERTRKELKRRYYDGSSPQQNPGSE